MAVQDLLTFSVLMIFSLKLLPCGAETLETKVDRLSDRLSLLDSKVSLDFISLRQDLGDVKKLVTDASKDGGGVTEVSVKDEDKSYVAEIDSLHKAIDKCYNKENALLEAFEEEKRRRKAVEEKLDLFKTEVFEDIKGKLGELLENAQQKTVSFSARALRIEDLNSWETVVFPDVANNRGGAYNSTSGIFVAPISGTYVFYCNILSKEHSYIELAVLVNEQIELLIYSAGDDNLGVGSNMVVIDLEESDIVKVVKYGPWGTRPFYIHNTWSTFSGFLLFKT